MDDVKNRWKMWNINVEDVGNEPVLLTDCRRVPASVRSQPSTVCLPSAGKTPCGPISHEARRPGSLCYNDVLRKPHKDMEHQERYAPECKKSLGSATVAAIFRVQRAYF